MKKKLIQCPICSEGFMSESQLVFLDDWGLVCKPCKEIHEHPEVW